MKLFGTPTSPYVRRVRVLAKELGLPLDFVDSRPPESQAELRRITPIWKIPAALVDGRAVFDSHTISDLLVDQHGYGPLRPAKDLVGERNVIHVIDGALDAGIRILYAKRDGLPDTTPFLVRERDRMASCMAWLDERVRGGSCTAEEGFGLAEIALATTLDWMRFRSAYDIGQHARLVAFSKAHEGRPSLLDTMPSEEMPSGS